MADAETRKFSEYVVPNMATNLVRTLLTALLGLMLTPFYIGELGEAWRILPLAVSVTAYVLLVTDEMTNAFSRYLVVAVHGGDRKEANKVYTTTVLGVGRIVAISIPFVILIAWISPYVFNADAGSEGSIQLLFLMILSSTMLVAFSACFNGIFTVFNKLYILNIARILFLSFQALFVVIFFLFKPSLEAIGASHVIASIIFFFLVWYFSRRLCPDLKIDRGSFDKKLIKEMGGLGIWIIVNRVGMLMFIQASLIMVNIFAPELGVDFGIVAVFISMTGNAFMVMTTALSPLFYLNYATKNIENLVRIAKTAVKVIGMLMAFPIAYICIFSPQILTAWLPNDLTHISGIVFMMFTVQVAVSAMNALETIPVLYMRVKEVAVVTVFVGIVSVMLTAFVLTMTDLGLIGVAAVWTASMFVLNVIMYPLMIARMIPVRWHTFLLPLISGHLALICCIAVGMVFSFFYTIPSTWFAILTSFLIGFVLYMGFVFTIGLNKEDKGMVRGILPSFIGRFIPKWML